MTRQAVIDRSILRDPARHIQRELVRRGWNEVDLQYELAAQLGFRRSLNTLKNWARGNTKPKTDDLEVLLRLFELTAQSVLESGWPRPMESTEYSAPLPSVLTLAAA